MSNWKDPNIKKHVSGEKPDITMSLFDDEFSFISNKTEDTEAFTKNRMGVFDNISITYPSMRILDERKLNIKLLANNKKISSTENQKPLMTSYLEYSETYFSNMILHINDVWGMMEYDNTQIDKINVPSSAQIAELISNINLVQHTRGNNVSELTVKYKIDKSFEFVSKIISDNIYTYANLISEKFRISVEEAEDFLNSNLFKRHTILSIMNKISPLESYKNKVKIFNNLFLKYLSNLNTYVAS